MTRFRHVANETTNLFNNKVFPTRTSKEISVFGTDLRQVVASIGYTGRCGRPQQQTLWCTILFVGSFELFWLCDFVGMDSRPAFQGPHWMLETGKACQSNHVRTSSTRTVCHRFMVFSIRTVFQVGLDVSLPSQIRLIEHQPSYCNPSPLTIRHMSDEPTTLPPL